MSNNPPVVAQTPASEHINGNEQQSVVEFPQPVDGHTDFQEWARLHLIGAIRYKELIPNDAKVDRELMHWGKAYKIICDA